jgi:hypothetical protein
VLWVGGVSYVVRKRRKNAPLCRILLVDELDRVLLVRSVLLVGRPSLASLLLLLLLLSIHASGGQVGFWPKREMAALTPDPSNAHPFLRAQSDQSAEQTCHTRQSLPRTEGREQDGVGREWTISLDGSCPYSQRVAQLRRIEDRALFSNTLPFRQIHPRLGAGSTAVLREGKRLTS